MSPRSDWVIAGLVLFALSGILFLIAGIRAGDVYTTVGSGIWLAGVGFFLMGNRTSK